MEEDDLYLDSESSDSDANFADHKVKMIQEVVGDMITNLGTEEERASVRNTLTNTIDMCA